MTARVVSLEPEEGFNPITLAGHREEVRLPACKAACLP
jgi:hypothetical protein